MLYLISCIGHLSYRETALMVDEATASPQQKQRVAIVVAHELAHQWYTQTHKHTHAPITV
jgi:hypothetical protein